MDLNQTFKQRNVGSDKVGNDEYTLFSTKLADPFVLHIYPPAKQFIQPCAFVIASVHNAHLTREI